MKLSVTLVVGNAITNAKVRGQAPALNKVRGPSPTSPPVQTPMGSDIWPIKQWQF